MNFLKKLNSRRFKMSVFSTLAILTLSLGQFFVVASAQAADPQFNTFAPYVHTQTYNRDYYLLDAKNDTQGTSWGFPVSANAGDLLTFYVYYHNSTNDSTAANTTLRVAMPSGQSTSQNVVAYVWADNATNATAANPFTQSLPVNLNSSQTLQVVSGSVKWFPNQADWRTAAPTAFPNGQSGDQLFSSGVNVGEMQGCWEFSSAIVFQARVSNTTVGTPNLSIAKTVRNVTSGQTSFSDSINASNTNLLEWQLQIQNTGTTNATNVLASDTLPSYMSYVSGSTKVDGGVVADGITSGNINVGSLASGATKTIVFQTNTNYSGSSNQTLTNYGYVRADGVTDRNDTAVVSIAGTILGTPNLSIAKTVLNVTDGQSSYSESANVENSEYVRWQIRVQNTGSVTATNVRVSDTLPSYMSYVSGSTLIDGIYDSTNPASTNLNLGSLTAGATKTITFQTQMNSSLPNSQTLTNYAYTSADSVSQISDTASVYTQGLTAGNLSISKTVRNLTTNQNSLSASTNASQGDRVLFLIQISTPVNSQTLNNVRVWDSLPAGLTYVSGSARIDNGYINDSLVSGGINVGTLSANQSRSINFEATVNSNYSNSTLINYAYASADGIPQNSAFAQVVLTQTNPVIVASSLYKRVENLTSPNGTNTDNTASVGDTLKYTLSYTNSSGATLTNAQILDVLPSYTTYYSVDSNGSYSSATNMLTWNFPSITPGSTVTVSHQVKVQNVPSDNYLIANTAAIKADNLSLVNSNETRTTVNAIIVPAVKGVSVAAVTGGDNIARNFAVSLMVSLWGIFFLYLIMENKEFWQNSKVKWAILKIKMQER